MDQVCAITLGRAAIRDLDPGSVIRYGFATLRYDVRFKASAHPIDIPLTLVCPEYTDG